MHLARTIKLLAALLAFLALPATAFAHPAVKHKPSHSRTPTDQNT
jgi:hypothetical protein